MLKYIFLFSLIVQVPMLSSQEVWDFIMNLKLSKRYFLYQLFNSAVNKKVEYQPYAQLLVSKTFNNSHKNNADVLLDEIIKKFRLCKACKDREEYKICEKQLETMLQKDPQIIYGIDKQGKTRLHFVAEKDGMIWSPTSSTLFTFFLNRANKDLINKQDHIGRTALHYLAGKGSEGKFEKHVGGFWQAIEFLIEAGADVNKKDNDGNTPIFHAIKARRSHHISTLLDHGADCSIKNNKGETPLAYAKRLNWFNRYEYVISILEDHISKLENDISVFD